MITRRYRCAWGAHEHSSEAGEWTILHRLSRQRYRQATEDGMAASLRSEGLNTTRRCPVNTEELSTLWRTPDDGENKQFILGFRLQ